MKYKFTNEHKKWVEELIQLTHKNVLKLWLEDVKGSVTALQLNNLETLTDDSRKEDVKNFIQWVTGGVRPGHPH